MLVEQLAIRCRSLTKRFGATRALDDFNLDVWEGSLVGLLGPSGCGKTTALRTIAGFESPEAGHIEVHGRTVVGDGVFEPPERRRVGMVFQDYALFPHMTVAQNVAYGLDATAPPGRLARVLQMVGLADQADRLPHELSGGQQQRVALARALAPKPAVVLLDEPFSNLDAALRDRVRRDVRRILRDARMTAVFVTHDQEEALAMSDVVAVMNDGQVLQAAPPDELYLRPATRWVAGFVGDADFVPGMARDGTVDSPLGRFATRHSGEVSVMVRPEAVHMEHDEDGNGRIEDREFFGHDQLYTVRLAGGEVVHVRTGPTPRFALDQAVRLRVEDVVTFPAGE